MPTNYEPSDEVRVFDGGDDDADVEGSRLPLLIVIALLVLAAFGGVVWLAYQRGVQQGHSEVPRVIAAEPGPAKVAPASPGGSTTPYTGLKIYQQPPPSNEDAGSATPVPTRTVAVKPAPAASAPAMTATKPVHVKTPATVVDATPVMPTQVEPAPATRKPATIRAAEGAGTRRVAAPLPDATPPLTLPATPAAASGSGVLQIGAYKSEADAGAAWTTYKSRHASLLAALSPDVKQVDLGAKGTWYRLRIIVSDESVASVLCEKLKSEGGACIPSK